MKVNMKNVNKSWLRGTGIGRIGVEQVEEGR